MRTVWNKMVSKNAVDEVEWRVNGEGNGRGKKRTSHARNSKGRPPRQHPPQPLDLALRV